MLKELKFWPQTYKDIMETSMDLHLYIRNPALWEKILNKKYELLKK